MKDRRKGNPDNRAPQDQKTERRRQSDRRKSSRVAVQFWVEESKEDELYYQLAGNLSAGGVQFSRTIPQPIGTIVKLKFQLPGTDSMIETSGEVVCSSGRPDGIGAGIKFMDLDPIEKKIILEFVQQQLTTPPSSEEKDN